MVSRNVDVGQTVAASMQAPTLFVIAKDLTQMQVSASIDESDIGRIKAGQLVTFRVDAYPDETFTGRVEQVRLQPVVQQNVVSYTTIISVPNRELKLKPGMTASVTVEIARADNVLRVPTAALRFRPTAEVFASLNQEAPAGLDGPPGARPGGDAPGAGAPVAAPSAAQAPPAPQGTAAPPPPPAAAAPPAQAPAGPFADMTPEQRQQMRERMQQMSPEERAQMRERMGGGPGGPLGEGRRGQGRFGPGERREGADGARGQGRTEGARRAGGQAGAPATQPPPRPVMRPVWILINGKLERMMVRIGINDGAQTAVLDGPIQQGAQVVTGVAVAQAAQQGGNPLFGGRFPGGPGFGGGGAPRGGFGGGGQRGGGSR